MSDAFPVYGIIVPAYNEAGMLPQTLAALHQAMVKITSPGRLIVVDNNSTDNTSKVAQKHGAQVVFEPHNQISKARTAGGRAAIEAGCRYLVFVDADTQPAPELLTEAVRLMQSGEALAGGALVAFDRDVFWLARWTIGLWNFYARRRQEAAGCFLFFTRQAFEGAQGFSEKVYASEEIWFIRAVKRWTKRERPEVMQPVKIIEEPKVVTSARKADRPVHTALTMLFLFAFPFAIYFRGLLGFWYRK